MINIHSVDCWCSVCQQERGLTRQQIGEQLDKDRALDSQVGGDHYRQFKIQPVEYIIANGIGFLAGNVIKYATRYSYKGGAEDIRKIIHYCELILEFEYPNQSGVSSKDTSFKGATDGQIDCQNPQCDPNQGVRGAGSKLPNSGQKSRS